MSRFLVLFMGTLCLAQPDVEPKLATIKGMVINSVTGEPLSKATFTVHAQSDERSDGGLAVEAKPSGDNVQVSLHPLTSPWPSASTGMEGSPTSPRR